jgi:hypothetical protein
MDNPSHGSNGKQKNHGQNTQVPIGNGPLAAENASSLRLALFLFLILRISFFVKIPCWTFWQSFLIFIFIVTKGSSGYRASLLVRTNRAIVLALGHNTRQP